MTRPAGIMAVDLMIDLPVDDAGKYAGLADRREDRSEFPAGLLFRERPAPAPPGADPAEMLIREMDRFDIEWGMIPVHPKDEKSVKALRRFPDRLVGSYEVAPHKGIDGVRALVRAYEELGVKAATASPAVYQPPVPINHASMYPLYAKCIELDLPICVMVGVLGPRLPFAAQDVALIDEVCYFFPELKFVCRHGGEPWVDLLVKLLVKWPGLYYSTSAFAPKRYPDQIIRLANGRGGDKIMYAGYYPMGLSLDRIFAEFDQVDLKPDVWPKFLSDNARRLFRIGNPAPEEDRP
jgi:predicted TIM-barrel fold metal-dependent hydrolase